MEQRDAWSTQQASEEQWQQFVRQSKLTAGKRASTVQGTEKFAAKRSVKTSVYAPQGPRDGGSHQQAESRLL